MCLPLIPPLSHSLPHLNQKTIAGKHTPCMRKPKSPPLLIFTLLRFKYLPLRRLQNCLHPGKINRGEGIRRARGHGQDRLRWFMCQIAADCAAQKGCGAASPKAASPCVKCVPGINTVSFQSATLRKVSVVTYFPPSGGEFNNSTKWTGGETRSVGKGGEPRAAES